MELKIRYDNAYQTLELDAKETEQLWVSLDLDGEGLTQEEREALIQRVWEERINRPEYNNWHKHNRHQGESMARPGKDETEDDVDAAEPLMDEVADDRIFRKDELSREEQESYEATLSPMSTIPVSSTFSTRKTSFVLSAPESPPAVSTRSTSRLPNPLRHGSRKAAR